MRWARVLLIFARPLVRIAKALESLNELYRLDLESRGVFKPDYSIKDPTELVYTDEEEKRPTYYEVSG